MPDQTHTLVELLAVAEFHKSPDSDSSGSCVEVATNLAYTHDAILVRDTKDRNGSVQRYNRTEWAAFLSGVRSGRFDL